MYKIIELGCEVPETGEQRVREVMDSLIKTAATDIQKFWDSLQRNDDFAYLWVIGVSAKEFYGCNNNGDSFSEEDLRRVHSDFVTNAHVYLQHVNKDPARSIGKPVFSWYNEEMHRVELILSVSKSNPDAGATISKIRNGEQLYVSMGCTVAYDECSICGNKAKTRKDYCDHLKYNMKKIISDGRQVYAMNPNPRFFDISIVAKPADPTAFALDKQASSGWFFPCEDTHCKTSAELGEEYEDIVRKVAALRKVSDIIKEVDGVVVDTKDSYEEDATLSEDDAAVARKVKALVDRGFSGMDYPTMPYNRLSSVGVSPVSFVSTLCGHGAPITLEDAAWMSGEHCLGRCPTGSEMSTMLSMLPDALCKLREMPELIGPIVQSVLSKYDGECDSALGREVVINIVRPVAVARISIVRGLGDNSVLRRIGLDTGVPAQQILKMASQFGIDAPVSPQIGRNVGERIRNDFSSRGENFHPIRATDGQGNTVLTSPYHVRQRMATYEVPLGAMKGLAGGTLALGAIGATLAEPSLLGKVISSIALGVPAAAILASGFGKEPTIETSDYSEVPVTTLVGAWKSKGVQKTASLNLGVAAGMAVPAALALDYGYNKWRYGQMHDVPKEHGGTGDVLSRVGRFIVDHPVSTHVAGGLIGSQAAKSGAVATRALRDFIRRGGR